MLPNIKQHIDSLTFNGLLKMYSELKEEIKKGLACKDYHKEELEHMRTLLKESFECYILDSRNSARVSDNDLQLFVSGFLKVVMF